MEWFLEHHLMVSNFRCVLELALRDMPDTELVAWKQGKEIWFRVTIPGERKRVVRVAPDAYFALRRGEHVRHFYLEADRGTETLRRIVEKFVSYWFHLQEVVLRGIDGDSQRVNVLFAAVGEGRATRLVNIFRSTPKPSRAAHGGRGLFLSCSEGDYTIDDPPSIMRSIWRSASASSVKTQLL